MKLPGTSRVGEGSAFRAGRGTFAFTMVEIALCLGVIAIALVSIIGVMPTGVRLQRDNQEATIINQDARLLIEAIRSGAVGMDYLTNHFERITLTSSSGGPATTREFVEGPPGNSLPNGVTVVGLLSNPKYLLLGNRIQTNKVTARVRAISGTALMDSDNPLVREMAFRYQLTSELIPLNVFPRDLTNFAARGLSPAEQQVRSNNWLMARNQAANFYELRLTLQGPMIKGSKTNYNVYGVPRTYRTMISGRLAPIAPPAPPAVPYLWLVQPNAYAKVSP